MALERLFVHLISLQGFDFGDCVAATKHAAHVCNLGQELGTLEPGKIADVLVVQGNPLKEIRALVETVLVIHEGEIIYRRK